MNFDQVINGVPLIFCGHGAGGVNQGVWYPGQSTHRYQFWDWAWSLGFCIKLALVCPLITLVGLARHCLDLPWDW